MMTETNITEGIHLELLMEHILQHEQELRGEKEAET